MGQLGVLPAFSVSIMSITVVLLVIASALAHATWNALLKRSSDPEHAITAMMTAASGIAVAIAIGLRVPTPPLSAVAWCLVAGCLEAGYFVTLARALSRAPFGSVYTVVRGGALVIVWPVSVLLLGEQLSIGRGAGTCLVVLGLAATGLGERAKTGNAHGRGVLGTARPSSGLLIAAICAIFVGGYQLAYKKSLSTGAPPETVNAMSLSAGTMLNLGMIGTDGRRLVVATMKREGARVLVGGALGSIGFLLFLLAMKNAGAGVVSTLRNTSILFAQILAVGLGERPNRLGVGGALLVVGGAVLLAR